MEGLSINGIENTLNDVVVTYTPSYNVYRYSYKIIKDNDVIETMDVLKNEIKEFTFSSTGTYKIEIQNYDRYGRESLLTSQEYVIDKEAPIINVENKTYKIKQGEEIDLFDGVVASDNYDGDLTNQIETNIHIIDFNEKGIKTIEYTVSDKAGNKTSEEAYVTVVANNTNIIKIGQLSIVLIFILLTLFIIKYVRSIKLEKRFSRYTINSSKNKFVSLFDSLNNQYKDFIRKMSIVLTKSTFLKNRAKRYKKYVEALGINDSDNMQFMASKIVLGFAFLIVTIVIKLIKSTLMQPLEMLGPFILGFYTLDILLVYKYINYKKKIENDMLEAITIMNNAFKAGMSIIQAIDLVSLKLNGPISNEFKKISQELSFGLDMEVAFKRFSSRIKIEEAVYLTSSLSVLNKTGGNIIKVFDSIEKTLLNRKKLQLELKSLTSSSKLIMYALILIPLVFVIFISIINKGYFEPLFTNPIGIVLLIIMLIIYISYIFVVNRVMKVRM